MRDKVRWCAVMCALGMAAAAPSPSAGRKAPADLPNFHVVHDFLLRGGEPSPAGIRELSKKGVRTIVDLRAVNAKSRRERALAESLEMRYIQLPMSSEAPTPAQVKTFLALTDDPKSRPVFVHCQHGSDRTGSMVGIYRVTHDGWSYDRAYAEMRKYYFTPAYRQLSGAVRRYAHGRTLP